MARFELLEPRNMLSLAPLAADPLPPSDVIETISPPFLSNRDSLENWRPELGLPPLPDDEKLWIPLPNLPTIPFEPAGPNLDPGWPSLPGENPEDFQPAEPADRTDGTIESEFGKADDASPTQSPATSERESKAVLDQLATLQYPSLAASAAQVDTAGNSIGVNGVLANRVWANERFFDLLPAVQLIAGDVDEPADSERAVTHANLLENVSIQVDNSAGRLLVFEMLTPEETVLGEADSRLDRANESESPLQESQVGENANNEVSLISGQQDRSNRSTEIGAAEFGGSDAIEQTAAGNLDSDQANLSWPVSVSLVAVGLVVKLLRERRFHRWQLVTQRTWRRFARFLHNKAKPAT